MLLRLASTSKGALTSLKGSHRLRTVSMKILFINQYYLPEEQNFYVHECASGLVARGHDVTVLTGFPNYGKGRVYDGYRGKLSMHETIGNVYVCRSWVYATPSKALLPRMLNFGSFCISSFFEGHFVVSRPDVVYCSIPPLPLGLTAAWLARYHRCPLVIHVQDIYPRLAVEHGMLTNRKAICFFEAMERWVYRKADRVVVISEGFRNDLISKGVPPEKIAVVENWADPEFVRVGIKDNGFRRALNADGRLILIYSGGINNNASLESVLHAAKLLRDGPFLFVIIGEGQYKPRLKELARDLTLTNVRFMPFQPLAHYPEVLAAADMNLVSLSGKSALSSVPSKVYKQMAAGRPILAVTESYNELYRLVTTAKCGVCVPTDDAEGVARALHWAASHSDELNAMGRNARRYFEEHHTVDHSLDRLSRVIESTRVSPVPAYAGAASGDT